MDTAFRAGVQLATIATNRSSIDVPANVAGSFGLSPKRNELRNRVRKGAVIKTGANTRKGETDSFGENPPDDLFSLCAQGHANTDLVHSAGYSRSNNAVHTNARE